MPSKTKIKICGLFREEDIGYANEVMPDYGGFILTPGFRRSITGQQAARFRERLNPGIRAVGVFVNHSRKEVAAYLNQEIIQAAQLHGDETEEDIQYIKALTGRPVMKAVKVRDRCDIEAWLDSAADYLVFDGGMGTGKAFEWNLLRGVKREYFLAGGLNPRNLPRALAAVKPYAVDLSSGVETEGLKDLEKMRRAVELVRNCRE